jgi:cell division protease FtsH
VRAGTDGPPEDARRIPGERAPGPRRRWGWRLVVLIAALLAANYWLSTVLLPGRPSPVHIAYSPTFLAQVQSGNVASITSVGDTIQGQLRRPVDLSGSSGAKPTTRFATEIPAFADTKALSGQLEHAGVEINAKPLATGTSRWLSVLFGFGPVLLLVGLWMYALRRASGGAGGLFSFSRAKPRLYEPLAERVTFQDVAGIDEAKDELREVVDFLREPERYRRLGARIPRGVLLTGPPGAGKTLLARAVAGEARVPFYSMSASEFVEMIVGVGASRVRDLFARVKATAPAIVFIDEIDAIGRSRSSGVGGFTGANDEREQTLNQVLTEMDGFDPATGVIVLAATNRPDVLDAALLRPGRFDRRIDLQPPDRHGREAILRVHARTLPLAPDVDLESIAAGTVGMVGADLANLANEAALLAARRRHSRVGTSDFADALERIVLGAERKVRLTAADRARTAYHESGHAIAGMLTPEADPVRKVSIIPRGMALGVTFAMPEADRFSYGAHYLRARIEVALAGRAAEELVFGDITTGAELDIRQASELARNMVGRWGMSPAVGPVAVLSPDGTMPFGDRTILEDVRRLVDREVRTILEDSLARVKTLLSAHRDKLDALAHALLRDETLEEADAYRAAGVPHASGTDRPAQLPAVG